MFADLRRRVSRWVAVLSKPAMAPVVAALAAGCFLLALDGAAQSLTGGRYVAHDDIGARASVALYYHGTPICGGVVFQDSYILTTAHCFTDGRGHVSASARGFRVRYWGSDKAKRDTRQGVKVAINENYLRQERLLYPSGPKPGDFADFPVNLEDIAVLKINGTHPAGSVSASVAGIDNDYTVEGPEKSTWFYIYGAAVDGSFDELQRALVGQYGRLDRVVPDKPPEVSYTVRQMTIITGGFSKDVSECKGDSGSGVFLVKSDGLEYDPDPAKLPDDIALKDDLPVLVGLVSQHPIKSARQKRARCGRDVDAEAFEATRVDTYHDWILSKIKEMQ
jgi:hypothetical protein